MHGKDRMNEKGMTLVEIMIAMVVLLFISLALMQTALLSIDSNMKNIIRDEAVSIADMRMSDARSLPFTATVTGVLVSDVNDAQLGGAACPTEFSSAFGTIGVLVRRDLRNIQNFNFCTNRTVVVLDAETRQVNITVQWAWKGVTYTHTDSTIIRRQS